MTKLLTPPLMFKGNQQSLAWARGVAEQGTKVETPGASIVNPTTEIANVSYALRDYIQIGCMWTCRIYATFDVIFMPRGYLNFVLPSFGPAYEYSVDSNQWSFGDLNVGSPPNLYRGWVQFGHPFTTMNFVDNAGAYYNLPVGTGYVIRGHLQYFTTRTV